MLSILIVIGCVLVLCMLFSQQIRETVDAACDGLQRFVESLLVACKAVLDRISPWVIREGPPSSTRSVLCIICIVICGFSIYGMYAMVAKILPYVFENPPMPLTFSIVMLGTLIGILSHEFQRGLVKYIAVFLAILFLFVLGALAYLQAATLVDLPPATASGLDISFGGQALNMSEVDDPVKSGWTLDPWLMAFLIVLVSTTEMVSVYGLLQMLRPGGLGYGWFVPLAFFAVVYGLCWVLHRSKFAAALKTMVVNFVDMCAAIQMLPNRWRDRRDKLKRETSQVFLSDSPLRTAEKIQRHQESKEEAKRRHELDLIRARARSELKTSRSIFRGIEGMISSSVNIIRGHVIQAAKQLSSEAEDLAQIILDAVEARLKSLLKKKKSASKNGRHTPSSIEEEYHEN